MTREEARIKLIEIRAQLEVILSMYGLEISEVFDMAIKALEQEPCGDAISRQAVLDMVEDMTDQFGNKHRVVTEDMISLLPPVTPKPKTGHWITQWNVVHQKEYYYCSECREEFSYDGETGIKMNDYNFCPACGAKMLPTDSEKEWLPQYEGKWVAEGEE